MLEFRSTWFLRVSSVALFLLRDVTGRPTCDWRSWFLCWNAEDVGRLAGVVIAALKNYFRWSLRLAMLRRCIQYRI